MKRTQLYTRDFTHKCIKMASKYIEVFILLVIRKMQIKTTKRCHCTPTATAKCEKTDNPILVKLCRI